MARTLKLSRDLSLPIDVAGEAIAILAKRGAGKTNTATVLVEELYAADVQTVILDPVGAWWGLRSGADGESEGLKIARLGGQHGDVPLEQTAGALIADVAVDSGQSLVVDLSDFPSKASVQRFVTDFAERLYRRKARDQSLLHLVLEEADEFAPQGQRNDTARMRGAIEQIVRRGRSRGLGVTLITQRSAVLNKDVLTQADVLIVMRTTGPHDVDAIKQWVAARGDEKGREVIESLPSLQTGEAWVWNPEHDILRRTKVRARKTFDSSQTPKAGQRRAEPRKVAEIDPAQLGKQIAETAEQAKANDPRELRKQIAKLRKQLQERPAEVETKIETVTERVEVPVFNGALDKLPEAVEALREVAERFEGGIREARRIAGASAPQAQGKRAEVARRLSADRTASARPPARRPAAAASISTQEDTEVRLGKGERTVLDVLAEYPEGRTYNELAFLAGYSAKASTLGVILSNLRKAGLVEAGNQPVRPTPEGLTEAGGARERPTGQALLDQWLRHPRMGEGERRVLTALIEMYPAEPSHDELCEATGYSPTASTMGVILSKLRKLGLVEKGARRVAAEFMESIEGAYV